VRLAFGIEPAWTGLMVEKGSVAVDGVSLTVAAVKENTFTIALIPFTLKHTTLGSLKKGGRVNIEVDVVARYLERLSSRTCLSRSER